MTIKCRLIIELQFQQCSFQTVKIHYASEVSRSEPCHNLKGSEYSVTVTLCNVALFQHTLQYHQCVSNQPFDVDAEVDAAVIGPVEPEHPGVGQVFALGQKLLQLRRRGSALLLLLNES